MRMVMTVAAALTLATPALALDPARDPDAPVALYTKQPAFAPSRSRTQSATSSGFFSFDAFGNTAPRTAASRTATRAHPWDASMDAAIARHAAANGVPIELARRVVMRESRGNPRAVSKGNYGLMQIRLGTARAMGYRGDAKGLLDPDVNMTYAMRYLAGAHRAAKGNHDRAVQFYARGYYYEAKAQGFSPYAPPREAAATPASLLSAN